MAHILLARGGVVELRILTPGEAAGCGRLAAAVEVALHRRMEVEVVLHRQPEVVEALHRQMEAEEERLRTLVAAEEAAVVRTPRSSPRTRRLFSLLKELADARRLVGLSYPLCSSR